MIFIFRLPGAEPERTIRLKNLLPNELYNLFWESEDELFQQRSGSELMSDGVLIDGLSEEDSVVLLLKKV